MRRILLILAVMALLMVALAVPAFAQAQPETFNERSPISFDLFNDCTGESVPLEGTIHTVAHFNTDAAGGVHLKGHINMQARGESTSGAKYILNFASQFEGKSDANSADVSTDTVNLELIRQGEDGTEDDFFLPLKIHFTQNANGEYTAEREFFELVCR
jgi:hypothetical protein